MDSLFAALPALGCLVMMPLMVWLMARGMGGHENPNRQQPDRRDEARAEELGQLRDEVARLRSEIDTEPRSQKPAGG